jgi:phytoene/squalene synthetase
MSGADAAAHFVGKWLQREPEMEFALLFCPPAQRASFQAWGALLHELREARFELRDPGVAESKQAWWSDELRLFAEGRPRHPLGAAFAGVAAPWPALARTLATPDAASRPADAAEALSTLRPLARTVTAVEAAIFDAADGAASGDALAVHWLLHRLPQGLVAEDAARIPMQLLARHAVSVDGLATAPPALLRDWAGQLLAMLPATLGGAPYFRRAALRFDRARLARLARDGSRFGPPAPAGHLWRAWRASRAA